MEARPVMWTYTPAIAEPPKVEQASVPEWERRPFALSPPSYYTQEYPGTERARIIRAMVEQMKVEAKEKSE